MAIRGRNRTRSRQGLSERVKGKSGKVVASWREWGAEVATYEFPADLQLEHDLIDPSKQTQPVVYVQLIDLITKHKVTRKGGAYKD